MIHSIAVAGGDSRSARLAQRHAIYMALLFQARLRVVVTWDAETTENVLANETSDDLLQSLIDEETESLLKEAGKARLLVEQTVAGQGLVEGLRAAARESDLLVVGLTGEEPEEQALLSKADSLILAVHQPLGRLQRILVDYQGGTEGKAALRIAGEIASRTRAAVTVLCVLGDIVVAETLTASAKRYLEAFDLVSVDTVEHRGNATSLKEVVGTAESIAADLLVVGKERHGFFAELRDRATVDPEDVAAEITIPLLIAR